MSPCVSSGTLPEVHPKRASWESTSNNLFGVLGLERARPKRRLRGGDVRAKITLFKKMTTEVPEIKLVKLLMISLLEKIHSWRDIVLVRHLLFIAERQPRYNKNLIQIIQYWCKGEKTSWWISLLFFNFIFHQLLITYNSITNFYPAYSTPLRLPSWLCHAFLQERIQKSSPRARKKLVRSWEGAPKKMCFHSLKKKMEVESKKLKKMMIFDVLVPEMKN